VLPSCSAACKPVAAALAGRGSSDVLGGGHRAGPIGGLEKWVRRVAREEVAFASEQSSAHEHAPGDRVT
jgi:hypothetical protein